MRSQAADEAGDDDQLCALPNVCSKYSTAGMHLEHGLDASTFKALKDLRNDLARQEAGG